MKQLFISAFIISSFSAMSQKLPHYFRLRAPVVIIPDSLRKATPFSAGIKPPTPGIYSMPQDRMPCLVPDTRDEPPIPNAWKGPITLPFSGNIPNPAIPKTLSLKNKKTG